jgi:hypothetical protein
VILGIFNNMYTSNNLFLSYNWNLYPLIVILCKTGTSDTFSLQKTPYPNEVDILVHLKTLSYWQCCYLCGQGHNDAWVGVMKDATNTLKHKFI